MRLSAIFNLVSPLPHEGTDRRITDTDGSSRGRSGAVPRLIGESLRLGDVDSETSTASPGIRTSTMVTRTTTTRTTSSARWPSADWDAVENDGFTFAELVDAYFDCRRTKRNSGNALAFEVDLERNLRALHDDLMDGSYRPGRSICFVITRPKPREVWAADFRDRIVHHLLYNRISPRFYRSFVADSCACIPGRGTLYAAKRLESQVRSCAQNWSKPAFYLKCDLANFFVSIDKRVLHQQLMAKIPSKWWRVLTKMVLWHDPRENVDMRCEPDLIALVPKHKRLTEQPAHLGLPIGNLSSQFFANVYLDALDQFVKHQIRAPRYVRYVDDFVLLHESPQWLNDAHARINEFLPQRLHAHLNPTKTILQPVDRGIDFVGHFLKPWNRSIRPRTRRQAAARLLEMPAVDVYQAANSYFGLLRQSPASHKHRAEIANITRQRGHSVSAALTKAYRSKA